jgi:hypothetical protein
MHNHKKLNKIDACSLEAFDNTCYQSEEEKR